MEEFVVYILYSERFNKNYTGFTSNLIERFKSHNYFSTAGTLTLLICLNSINDA
jgi:putative endonuclease